MKRYRWLTLIAAVLITVVEVLIFAGASSTANAASPSPCDMRLTIQLTPDVPNPDDVGFLSSLLSNQAGYRLTLQPQGDDPTVIVLDLTGPGPGYRCQNVIETMRRDARVLSVHVDSDETQAVSVVTAPVPPEESNVHLSRAGIGSLYWAARNPAQALRVVFPVQPGDAADADIKARCAFITNAPSGRAACP